MHYKTFSHIQKTVFFFIGLIITMGTISCRKEMPLLNEPNKYGVNSYSEVFESFWTGMNNNYVFWDVEPTNWDDVYVKYKPLFAKLDIKKTTDQKIANDYIRSMTENLIDGHYRITIAPEFGDENISPSDERYNKSADYRLKIPNFYFSDILANKYLDDDFLAFDDDLYDNNGDIDTENYVMVSGTIKEKILYIHFSDFNLSQIVSNHFRDDIRVRLMKIFEFYLNSLNNNKALKGLVIDLRSNNGGIADDLKLLVGALTDKTFKFGNLHYKNGLNRLNYTPWIDAKVYPMPDAVPFNKPIVVLVDKHSVSMAEISAMALKNLPSNPATVVGERTWGGTGPLESDMTKFSGGQFSTPYFKMVYTSTAALRYLDGKSYEGVGFPPDIEVKYNRAELSAGIDRQLEKAISVIEGKN